MVQHTVLLAEGDIDLPLILNALARCTPPARVISVESGTDLLQYIARTGRYADPDSSPRPNLVIIDLDLVGEDAWTALDMIRSSVQLRRTPVILTVAAGDTRDVSEGYVRGASAVITKPEASSDQRKFVDIVAEFWFNTVQLPPSVMA